MTWTRMKRHIDALIPAGRITHPYPDKRLHVKTRGMSPVRSLRSPGSMRGAPRNRRPYRDPGEERLSHLDALAARGV